MANRDVLVLLGNIIPFIIASVFFAGRGYCRALILRNWGSDDWCLALGWVWALANCIMASMKAKYVDDPSAFTNVTANQLNYGTLIAYQASLCFTKLSITVLYLRVFTTSRGNRWFLYGVVAFIAVSTICLEGVSIFQCTPVSGAWDKTIHTTCINTIPAFWISSVENILIDMVLMAFAFPKVLHLKMVPRQKYALLATIGLGFIPIIASLVRCILIGEVFSGGNFANAAYSTSIWSAVDANISIICASAPALKPLIRLIVPAALGSSFATSRGPSDHTYPGSTKSWLGTTKSADGVFELDNVRGEVRILNAAVLQSHSGGSSEWTPGKPNESVIDEESLHSDDDSALDGAGIMKHTQITVTSLPL